jgi:hypothetical protein
VELQTDAESLHGNVNGKAPLFKSRLQIFSIACAREKHDVFARRDNPNEPLEDGAGPFTSGCGREFQ